MLGKHEFCDHCPGCRPALISTRTGEALPDDSPIMIAVYRIWNTQTSYAERKAFINVTSHNSRDPNDLSLAIAVTARFAKWMTMNGVKP